MKTIGSGPNEYYVVYETAYRHALAMMDFFRGGELKYGTMVRAKTAAEAISVDYDNGNSDAKEEIVDYAGTDVDHAVYFDGSCSDGYIAINMRLHGTIKKKTKRKTE